MARKANPKRQQRKKQRKAAAGPKRPKTMSAPVQDVKFARALCALTDPFCVGARGVKYPDSTAVNTLAWTSEGYYNLTTDVNGHAAGFFGSEPNQGFSFANGWSGSTNIVTTTSNAVAYPGWTSFPATTQWRLVSMGVQIRSTLSSMENSGSLGILVMPAASGKIAINNVDVDSLINAANSRVSCNSGSVLSASSRGDGIVSKTFEASVATGVNEVQSWGNDILVPYIVNGPASKICAQIYFVAHYELVFATGSLFNTVSTPAATESPVLKAGANLVQRSMDLVIKGGTQEFERQIMSRAMLAGRQLFRAGAAAIGGLYGGPSGAAIGYSGAGMILDVD